MAKNLSYKYGKYNSTKLSSPYPYACDGCSDSMVTQLLSIEKRAYYSESLNDNSLVSINLEFVWFCSKSCLELWLVRSL